MIWNIRGRAALAGAGVAVLSGSAHASLVGYRFHGSVDGLSSTGGTAYSGVSLTDAAWIDVFFDPASGPALTAGSMYAFDYDIASLTMNIGGVTPGAAQSLTGTTLWGFNDAVSSGNDSLTQVGSFTSGEFLILSATFSGTGAFTVPGAGTPTMPTDLDTQTLLDAYASISLGGGSSVWLDLDSIEYLGAASRSVPAPGTAALGMGVLALSARRRRV